MIRSTVCGEKKRENDRENFARPFTPQNQLRSPRNFVKMRFRQFRTFRFFTSKKFVSKKMASNMRFCMFFARFLRSYAKSDITSRFLAKFCSRLTYYEVCTTKHQKNTCVSDFVFPFFLTTDGRGELFTLLWVQERTGLLANL